MVKTKDSIATLPEYDAAMQKVLVGQTADARPTASVVRTISGERKLTSLAIRGARRVGKGGRGIGFGTERVPPCPRGTARPRGHGGTSSCTNLNLRGRLCPPYRAPRIQARQFTLPLMVRTTLAVGRASAVWPTSTFCIAASYCGSVAMVSLVLTHTTL